LGIGKSIFGQVKSPMHRISEDQTRKSLIDPQLERAGWTLRDHSKVKIEIPVDGYDKEPWNGVTDYCLYRENGEILAVVEAKKTAVDVRLAEAQLTHYVTEIEKRQSFRPFGFVVTPSNWTEKWRLLSS
jgi:type I site-specific restriction endonuclease